MTTHVQLHDELARHPLCGELEPGDDVITMEEAQDPDGRHFDCVNCHRALTFNRRHARPDDTAVD